MTNLPKTIRALKACIAELEHVNEGLGFEIIELEKENDELEKRCDKEFKDGFWRGFEVRAMNPVDSCIQGHYDWQVHLREQGE